MRHNKVCVRQILRNERRLLQILQGEGAAGIQVKFDGFDNKLCPCVLPQLILHHYCHWIPAALDLLHFGAHHFQQPSAPGVELFFETDEPFLSIQDFASNTRLSFLSFDPFQ